VQRRFGTVRSLYAVLVVVAADLLVMGLFTGSQLTLIVAVIVSGLFLGINNTLVTEAVMKVSPVERPVASASYSFVRFMGGAIAPYLAGKLAERFNPHLPFYVGAGAVAIAIGVLAGGHRVLRGLDRPVAVSDEELEAEFESVPEEAALAPGEAAAPARR
jgi:ACDE family multidrug resistance protein